MGGVSPAVPEGQNVVLLPESLCGPVYARVVSRYRDKAWTMRAAGGMDKTRVRCSGKPTRLGYTRWECAGRVWLDYWWDLFRDEYS